MSLGERLDDRQTQSHPTLVLRIGFSLVENFLDKNSGNWSDLANAIRRAKLLHFY